VRCGNPPLHKRVRKRLLLSYLPAHQGYFPRLVPSGGSLIEINGRTWNIDPLRVSRRVAKPDFIRST
jgi:hypothetical protein